MERVRNLDRYQKGILILLAAMVLIFGVAYTMVTSRTGFLYMDKILEPSVENGNKIYSGKIRDENCRFTVTEDKSVTFHHGENVYGPYTAREDSTAIPDGKSYLTGVEILDGDNIFFRGGVYRSGDDLMLFEEDGGIILSITVFSSDGVEVDADGRVVDQMEPSATSILELMEGLELTHKGQWRGWLFGLVICVITAVSILYADELFRLNLGFQIRNVEDAEPSEWEMAGRYISWTIMPFLALAVYVIGLQ